jgi:hypothetical protein
MLLSVTFCHFLLHAVAHFFTFSLGNCRKFFCILYSFSTVSLHLLYTFCTLSLHFLFAGATLWLILVRDLSESSLLKVRDVSEESKMKVRGGKKGNERKRGGGLEQLGETISRIDEISNSKLKFPAYLFTIPLFYPLVFVPQ